MGYKDSKLKYTEAKDQVNEEIKLDNRFITEEGFYYQDEEIKVDSRIIIEENSYHQDDFYEKEKQMDSIVDRSNQFYILFFKIWYLLTFICLIFKHYCFDNTHNLEKKKMRKKNVYLVPVVNDVKSYYKGRNGKNKQVSYQNINPIFCSTSLLNIIIAF